MYGNIHDRSKEEKKNVKFSSKIPPLTSTAYHLLSDRLLWWKEPILVSCPFRGFLHSKEIKEAINKRCLDLKNEDWENICEKADPHEAHSCFWEKFDENILIIGEKL